VYYSATPPANLPQGSSWTASISVQALANATLGPQTINIAAQGGGQTVYLPLTVNIVPAIALATPAQANVLVGNSVTLNGTIIPQNGFAGTVMRLG
jgi:hypothetical protein